MSLLDLFEPKRPPIRNARRERLGKSAKAKYDRERYERKRTELLAANQAWYQRNKERIRERNRAYYAANRERIIANSTIRVRTLRAAKKAER